MEKYIYKENDEGETEAFITPEYEEFRTRKKIERKLKEAGISSTKWEYTFSTYKGTDPLNNIPKLKKFCDKFEEAKGVHLYLWSRKNSTQKSTLASIIAMSLVAKGYKVRFILMSTLVYNLQQENFKPECKEFIEDVEDADFLVIDDSFDKTKVTMYKSGYQISFIDNFLRKRLDVDTRNTCFTSNYPISELKETYGQHIHALIERHVKKPMEFSEPINDFNVETFWDE